MARERLPYVVIPETEQRYYQSGNNPTLLIAGQTHGDEAEIVPFVEQAVEKYRLRLPPFLFIREISPSATKLGTRENKEGFDVNRSFLNPPPTQEVSTMMELWSKFNFDIFITFHTDPTGTDFYLYDGHRDEDHDTRRLDTSKEFLLLQQDITQLGVRLYNGLDDPDDPTLGYRVQDGYVYWPMSTKVNDHASDYWLIMEAGRAKQVINPEIPGKANPEQKSKIVDAIFKRLIIKDMTNNIV